MLLNDYCDGREGKLDMQHLICHHTFTMALEISMK